MSEPAILRARAWLIAYDGRCGAPLDFTQAAPPYPPHADLLEQLGRAARDPDAARYGAVRGEAALRERYAAHLSDLLAGSVSHETITITAGCNQAFFIAALALLQAGDAVLVPTPWYFNHAMTLGMLGVDVRPLASRSERGFVPDPEQAEELCDERVRAIVLVTPNNPTGATYPPATIAAFHALCRRRGLWLILDETYRDFRSEGVGRPHEIARDGWPDEVVGLYSFSKAYAVPGHRLGAITAPHALAASILKVQDCVQICAGRPIQVALTWGLTDLASWREERRQTVARAGETFCAAMGSAIGWSIASLGAYFAYLRHPHRGVPAAVVAERLARERGVLILPGSDFGPGQERYLRLSFPGLTPAQASQLPQRLALP